MNFTLYGQRDFADGLRTLRREMILDYAGRLVSSRHSLQDGQRRSPRQRGRWWDVGTEDGALCFEDKGRGYKQTDTGGR